MTIHKMQYRMHLLVFTLLIGIVSCKKYEEETISGNQAPPDGTVSTVTIENYVNKVYISVLGRKPDQTESGAGISILRQTNLSGPGRMQFLDEVFSNPEYKTNLYEKAKIDLLNNLDTTEIAVYISIFNTLLLDSAYMASWDLLQAELNRLYDMQNISIDMQTGALDERGLFRRCCNNYFYDQINMGSLNFVVSLFQHFLDRYPTDYELQQGIQIVNGNSGTLFLQTGLSKSDLLDIFFASSDYYEGQVRQYYKRYLFRSPGSSEMGLATQKYQSTGDYEQMQKDILATNEYIGI